MRRPRALHRRYGRAKPSVMVHGQRVTYFVTHTGDDGYNVRTLAEAKRLRASVETERKEPFYIYERRGGELLPIRENRAHRRARGA